MNNSSPTELERRVIDALHHHAEHAMSTTDTEARFDAFVAGTESSRRQRRVTWGIGAVAVAAAVVVALVLGGVPGLSSDEAELQLPARDRTPVQVATDFVDALAAYDAEAARRDVGTSEDNLRIWPGEPSLRDGLAWAEAAGYRLSPEGCVRDRRTESETTVDCRFGWHFLGSDRLGQPPYVGEYSIWVDNGGRIVHADVSPPGWYFFGLSGGSAWWDPFAAWLGREHPEAGTDLFAKHEGCDFCSWPVWTDASYALWATYVDEWVASQQ